MRGGLSPSRRYELSSVGELLSSLSGLQGLAMVPGVAVLRRGRPLETRLMAVGAAGGRGGAGGGVGPDVISCCACKQSNAGRQ